MSASFCAIKAAKSSALGARALRDLYLLVQQHASHTETRRERVVLQRRIDGLDRHDAGGAMQHHCAHCTPGADGPSRRGGLGLIPIASAMERDLDMEASRRPGLWG